MSFPAIQPDHHATAADAVTDDVVMDEAAPRTNARALWSMSRLFIGTSCTGKSTLANAVAGLPAFSTGIFSIGITQDVQYHDLGTGVRLIDTPGIDVDAVDPEADVAHLLARVPHGRPTTVVLVVRIGVKHVVSDDDRKLARIVQKQVAAMAGRDARCAVVFNHATLAARRAIQADPGSFLRQVFDESTVEDVGTVQCTAVPWFIDAAVGSNVMLPPSVQADLRAFVEALPFVMLELPRTTTAEQQQPQANRDMQPPPAQPSWFAPSPFSLPVASSPTPTAAVIVSAAAPSSPRAAERAFADRDSVLGTRFSPPKDILFSGTLAQVRLNFDAAQLRAYEDQKWLLVDVYDPSNLTSLARSWDVWHNETVKSIILDQFVFIQVPVHDNTEGVEHVVIYEPSTGKRRAMIGGERDLTVKYRKAALLNDPNDVAEFLLEFTAEYGVPDKKSGGIRVLAGMAAGNSVSPSELSEIEGFEFQLALWASLQGTGAREEVSADAQASSSGAFPASSVGGVGITGAQ
ncbi:UBX domain-containing protein 7 [Allomyces arbusculus]|nr:UBX domain-containing protein 7 [Allomyces arbusculus]